jgi:hypothetical protein
LTVDRLPDAHAYTTICRGVHFEGNHCLAEVQNMAEYFDIAWQRVAATPDDVWMWFGRLNREEWLVTLAVVCACGFVSLLGFRSQRL